MQCPKCEATMEAIDFKGIEVDRCSGCKGIWFDLKEAELLLREEGAEVIDDGDEFVGARFNEMRDINCPKCRVPMSMLSETNDAGVIYEICPRCYGAFYDAGEFSDYLEERIVEQFSRYRRQLENRNK